MGTHTHLYTSTTMAAIAAPMTSLASLAGQKVQSRQAVKVNKVAFSVQAMKVKKGINKAKKGGAPNTGVSEEMNKKGWVDASGREGKGYGVFRFDSKYVPTSMATPPSGAPTSGPRPATPTRRAPLSLPSGSVSSALASASLATSSSPPPPSRYV